MLAVYYRRDIDGLRAIAVIPVILFHAGFSLFSGGYVGVDVFFVISGYLITSILLRELAEGRFSILTFYERRIRRILPALFVMLAFSLPVAWLIMLPGDFQNFAMSLAATALSLSNLYFASQNDYFDIDAEKMPLLHTWSLAVEEQYYVILPVLLLVLWRLRPAAMAWVIAALALASLALSEWLWRVHTEANFFLLPSRAWELFAGSLCALALRDGRQPRSEVGAAFGLALIVGSIFVFDDLTPWPSLFTLAPVGGTVLVILCAPGTVAARFLGRAPFVWIGLISYSAYLWHQPVFAFFRIHAIFEPSTPSMLALSGLTLGLAWLSWRFVEQPFRRKRPHVPAVQPHRGRGRLLGGRAPLFATALAVSLAFLAVGLAGARTDLHAQHWRARMDAEAVRTNDIVKAAQHGPYARWDIARNADGCVFLANRQMRPATVQRILDCAERHGPGLVVLGDSHARGIFGAIASASDMPFIVGIVGNACRLHALRPGCPFDPFLDLVSENRQVFASVVLEFAGFYMLHDKDGRGGEREMFGEIAMDERVPDFPVNPQAVAALAAYLRQLSPHINTVLLGPRAEPHIPLPYLIRNGCSADYALRDNQLGPYRSLEAALRAALAGTDIAFVSQIDIVSLDLSRDLITCEAFYWQDGDHLSAAGLKHFGPRILAGLSEAKRKVKQARRDAD